jgi:hypothetical protein
MYICIFDILAIVRRKKNKNVTHPGTGGCSLLTISGGNGTEGFLSSSLLSLIYLSPESSILCLSKFSKIFFR